MTSAVALATAFHRLLAPTIALALPLALVAGTHAATWGAYKDAPYEGYHPSRQLRTLVIATLATFVGLMTGLVTLHAVVPAVGVVYTLERLSTEWWKTIVRVDDQSAYTIPMRLGFFGRPVDVDWIRYSVGALVAGALVGLGFAAHGAQAVAQHAFGGLPWWILVPTVGGLGGWLTAVGGAWKDAPIEGFSGWKFLRSPAVATAWAVPLSQLTGEWVALCLAAGGLSVFSIETYKTFWTGARPPGKFADRPLASPVLTTRRVNGRLHAGAWLVLGAISAQQALETSRPPAVVSSALVAGICLLAAWFVLRANVRLTTPAGVRVPTAVTTADELFTSVPPAGRRRSAESHAA